MPWAAIMAIATALSAVTGVARLGQEEEEEKVGMRGYTGDRYTQHERGPGRRFGEGVGSTQRKEGLMDAVSRSGRY